MKRKKKKKKKRERERERRTRKLTFDFLTFDTHTKRTHALFGGIGF